MRCVRCAPDCRRHVVAVNKPETLRFLHSGIPLPLPPPVKAGHPAMFLDTIEKKQLTFDRKKLDDAELLDIYERLLRPRLIEEKMLSMLR